MANEYSTAAKNAMLDALDPDEISLHTGDPGAAGTDNELSGGGYSRQAATFNAASSGQRTLSANVDFTGTPSTAVSYIGVWDGATFLGRTLLTGDTTLNSLGEFTVLGTTTLLEITDPA